MIKFWSKVRPTNPCGAFVLHLSSWTDSQGPDGRLTPTPTTQSGCFILRHFPIIRSYLLVLFQFSSVHFSRLIISNSLRPLDCSTPGFSVHHQLLELAQTHVHGVSDAVQPSHLLSSPFPTFNLSQQQGLFWWVSSSHQVAKVLEFQLQHQSFQWIFRTDFLEDWLVGSPCSPRDSQESSPTPHFKRINSLVLSFFYSPTLTSIHDYLKNHSFD